MLTCTCDHKATDCKLIALTGGPGAGKTAILQMARQIFCRHVVILPEAATIVYGGGFLRRDTVPSQKACQRAIFNVQRAHEIMVQEEHAYTMALCDRGTIDGSAYWPVLEPDFFADMGTTREKELAHYHAVIHLRTPPEDHGYNLDNPTRTEDPQFAAVIDKRVEQAWEGHPRRFFVESTPEFLEKATRTLELIKKELPACCRAQTH